MVEQKLLELIERYLNGELNSEELARFELLRQENTDLNERIQTHKQFTDTIKHYGERIELEKRLNAFHQEIDVHALKEELTVHPMWIVKLWRNHHSKISVAASIAIFTVLMTLIVSGYFNNRETNYVQLKGQVAQIQKAVNGLKTHNSISHSNNILKTSNFRGTGFAISSNGYIVTNYHVINNADSVYVENANGKSYHTKVIYTEPETDIAILSVDDTAFKNLGNVPYNIKKGESNIAENVYTLGYPREAIVFNSGYLSATTGFTNDNALDSTSYQVSLQVNPGNSGGPLIDSRGNLIGVISAKATRMEGAHFAIKSSYLLKAIHDIPSDSLNKPLNINSRNTLAGLNKEQQVNKLKDFVFMVKVFKQ